MRGVAASARLEVGVVIPAHNEGATLGLALEALGAQDWPGLRVLVVDDGSTDDTGAVAARHGVRQIVQRPNRGLARSISAGLEALAAEGADVGIVLHADCVPQGGRWVQAMLAPFEDPRVGAVVSSRRLAGRPRGAERFFDAVAPQDFPNPEGRDREVLFFRDKCDAYRLGTLRALGGFDTVAFHAAGEDTDLSLRMRAKGFRIVQSGSAVVEIGFSSHQRGLRQVFRKALQYGGAQAVLYRRHRHDGLKARAFAGGLLALAGAAVASVAPMPAWVLVAPALFLQATTPVAVGVLGEPPLGLVAVFLGALLQSLGWPASLAWASGAAAAAAGLALRRTLQAARRLAGHGECAGGVLGGAAVAFGWWVLTGLGYGMARCRPSAR